LKSELVEEDKKNYSGRGNLQKSGKAQAYFKREELSTSTVYSFDGKVFD
jgi:hypothetical protein